MYRGIRRLAAVAALGAATVLPLAAQATLIDFEDPLLTGLYFSGDTFSQAGFLMTQEVGDSGIVDRALSLGAAAPTNNLTQYYANTNDGGLLLTSVSGRPFSLDGFDAAFVPLLGSHAPPQTLGIVAVATTATGASFGTLFGLGNTTSVTQGSPFLTFAGAANFARFSNLISVDFFTCTIADSQLCTLLTQNNGQFALDNIRVTAPVPEPETYALMMAGIAALAAVARRRRRL